MAKDMIETQDAPAAIGPYSQAVRAGGWIFLSGQLPLAPETGQMVDGGVPEQTRQVLRNIEAVLRAAGAGMGDVVKTTVYMRDLGEFARMNEVYASAFPAPAPARAAVEVSALPKDALVEIDAVARDPGA
ncbi:MAG: Rid family detoxifying hydrolase [Elusimicrobiota bacterium]